MTPGGTSCARAAELLSDHREGLLEGPLAAEMDAHLAGCPECRSLFEALGEVLDLLRSDVEVSPASDLAERAANAALAAGRRPRLRLAASAGRVASALTDRAARWGVPARVQALAAVLAIALTAGVLLAGQALEPGPGEEARPAMVRRLDAATVYVAARRDQLVEDFRLLKVVIATAFEGRLDRVNDRVEDYRRLLERRRQEDQAKDNKKSQASLDAPGWAWRLPLSLPWTGNI